MASKWFKQRSQRLYLTSKGRKSAGFTLIELLVAMFIGGVITSILLFLVVQLLQTSQRESARSDTQREMQMALDYIGRDLREAVYVYDGNCLATTPPAGSTCKGLLSYLPSTVVNGASSANSLPVLAFWRVDPLPLDIDKLCEKSAKDGAFSEADKTAQKAALLPIDGIPCVSRRMYTLVVYSLDWNKGQPWSGQARIKRYQLPQYAYGVTTNTVTPGWGFPAGSGAFMTWPFNANNVDQRKSTGDGGNSQMLVDFVAQKGLSDSATDAVCPAAVTTPGYVLTPTAATAGKNRGFYVCVKGAESNGKLNQEVSVFLQGNAAGRPGLPLGASDVPISMQTRVMTRGALEKEI